MAVYKSQFKGSQIDDAVSVANANVNKGSADTPIYYDNSGTAQPIEKDSTVTASSTKPLTSGGAYTGLETVVDNSDIQYENFNGEFTKVGNVQIVDGVASGLNSNNYLVTPSIDFSKHWVIKGSFTTGTLSNWNYPFSFGTNGQNFFLLNINSIRFVINELSIDNCNDWSPTTQDNTSYSVELYWDGIKYGYNLYDANNLLISSQSVNSSLHCSDSTIRLGMGDIYGGMDGSINLNFFSVILDDQEVYTPYPNPALPPSQNATKQYIDTEEATKQEQMYDGYGIDLDGTTVSVSNDIFREGDNLHADLKVDHFGDMSVGNDSEVLKLMNEAKHSTFDLSKFTKNGGWSGIITADGIASGFSSSGWLLYPSYNFVNTATLEFEFTPDKITNTGNQGLLGGGTSGGLILRQVDDKLIIFISVNGSSWAIGNTVIYSGLVAGTSYKVKIVFNSLGLIVYVNGTQEYSNQTVGKVYALPTEIGRINFSGTIDLKQFSITVDGVPVFSGNKTGIDTIKPVNFTAVTSSTSSPFVDPSLPFSDSGLAITEDGVMSASDYNNYVKFSMPALGDNFDIIIPYNKPTIYEWHGADTILRSESIGYEKFSIGSYGQDFVLFLEDVNNNAIGTYFGLKINASIIGKYFIKLSCRFISGVYTLSIYGSCDGNNWTFDKAITSSAAFYVCNNAVTEARLCASYRDTGSSIDLNNFKVYVNGNIIYQPCLKIPYTLAKGSKKVVDEIYKGRVEDEYNQAGYTPYYTLHEDNKGEYTLVGTPSISDDYVMNGIIDGNYLRTNGVFNFGIYDSWSIIAKFKTSTNLGLAALMGSAKVRAVNLYTNSDNSINTELSSAGTAWDIGTLRSGDVPIGTDFYYKVEFTGTQYNCYLSSDGTNYTLKDSIESSTKVLQGLSAFNIGADYFN